MNNYFTSNPNVTQAQLANTISTQGGMTPEIAQALANHYGTDVATVNSTYNNLIGNTGAQTANTSTSNSPLSATTANTSNTATQTSPLTQLQGVQNTIQGLNSGSTSPNPSQNFQVQTDIQNWIAAHPNASSSDIANAVSGYTKSSGINASDIYSNLGVLASQNPNQYESTLQNFNTAEGIDPSKAFMNYLQQNATQGYGGYTLPDESKIIQEANKVGYNLANLPDVGTLEYKLFNGIPVNNISGINTANNVANTLASQKNVSANSILNGQADDQTQNQFGALSSVLSATPNSSNYKNMSVLANAGVTPDLYAKTAGISPISAVNMFNSALNPQAPADSLAAQAGVPKGTSYTYGINGYNTPVIMYTDPRTGQQMAYTAGGGAGYQTLPAAGAQAAHLLPPTNQVTTYTYGQSKYVNPFNAKGQVDTTNAAALDSAYKSGLISTTDYLNAKQALTKKTT